MSGIIAFDAATTTGWAYRFGRGPCEGEWSTGIVKPKDWKMLDGVLCVAEYNGVERVVIEDCYLGVNPQTHKILAIVQGLIISACDRARLPYDVISAATWHADLGLTGKREDRKRGAKMVAIKVLGALPGISQDEADSVCLCDMAERVVSAREVRT